MASSKAYPILLGVLVGVSLQPGGAHAHEDIAYVGDSLVSLEEMKPQDRFTYVLARDREYISYVAALDLSSEKKNRLWDHLTRTHGRYAQLDLWAEQDLGKTYASEVDLLVITYDQNSEYQKRREEIRRKAEEELQAILDPEELEIHRRHAVVAEQQRYRRQLGQDVENMELGLTPVQFDVALTVMENKPAFFQEAAVEGGASGYSSSYIQERERWRFEQEQDYLEAKLIPLLKERQLKRFRTWQEAQRLELNRSLDMYRTGQELIAKLYPEGKRRVQMLTPAPTAGRSEKHVVYIECRQNQLFRIPVDEIRGRSSKALKEIAARSEGSSRSLMQELAVARVETDAYRADLTYALLGQLVLRPRKRAAGHDLLDLREEGVKGWYANILSDIDPAETKVIFVVRDDSIEVFDRAHTLAEGRGIEVSHELLDPMAPIKFALGGTTAIISAKALQEKTVSPATRNGKSAYYVEVQSDRVVIFPGGEVVEENDLSETGNPWSNLLEQVAQNTNRQYVVMLVQPHSAKLAAKVQNVLAERGIEVGQELYQSESPAP